MERERKMERKMKMKPRGLEGVREEVKVRHQSKRYGTYLPTNLPTYQQGEMLTSIPTLYTVLVRVNLRLPTS
jgi:hypothetical protein